MLPPRALRGFALLLALSAATAVAQEVPPETEILPAAESPGHLPEGVPYDYGTPFPTSGPHSHHGTIASFYTEPQPATALVHALEHGNVVIYYDTPGEEVLDKLLALTRDHSGERDGITAVPAPGIGEQIVLTAWERRLILPRYDEGKASAFIAAFLGRGADAPPH
jgi:hypothetical protein